MPSMWILPRWEDREDTIPAWGSNNGCKTDLFQGAIQNVGVMGLWHSMFSDPWFPCA